MKPYLFIAMLLITASCGYENINCIDDHLVVRLDSFSKEERDSIILEKYDGPDFITRIDSSLIGADYQVNYFGTKPFTLTLASLGITYRFSDIQYAGKTTERRKKVVDFGGSYHPSPCFNNVATVTLDDKKLSFQGTRQLLPWKESKVILITFSAHYCLFPLARMFRRAFVSIKSPGLMIGIPGGEAQNY